MFCMEINTDLNSEIIMKIGQGYAKRPIGVEALLNHNSLALRIRYLKLMSTKNQVKEIYHCKSWKKL